MKIISIILTLFFFTCLSTQATTYYISNSGNVSNNGTSPSTSWPLSKVNSFAFAAGDNILFNRGESFYGAITVSHSGSSGNVITYGAYGTGANPVITGFTNVTSWTNLGGNIYESTSAVSTLSNCNVVSINGVNTAMGRTPNTGFYTYQSSSGTTSITSSSLNASVINWTGAQAVIRKERYVFTKPTITSASGSTVNFANDGYNGKANWGFFIQNDIRTLDQQNEWYYNPTTHKIDIYSTSTPTNVQVASVDALVTATNVNYITFDGISFTGGNAEAFYAGNFSNCKIQNCSFDFNYQAFHDANLGGSSANMFINNNTFNHTNNDGIDFGTGFTSPTITHNIIKNTSVFEGMMATGQSGWAINITSSNALIQYNEVDSSGYIAIGFNCTSSSPMIVKNNYVNTFCFLKDDGGGIYSGNAQVSQVIDSNIVINGIGNNAGAGGTTSLLASGIYCDDNSSGFTIRHNSIANISYAGLYLHNANNCTVTYNTFYACGLGEFISNDNSATFTTNIYSHQNKIIAQTTGVTFSPQDQRTIDCATAHTTGTDIRNFGDIDSNYYARPINDNLTIRYTIYGVADNDANLAMWQTYSAFDLHSHKSPASITNVNQLFFAYNHNSYDSTVTIPSGTWIDVTGTPYNTGSTILHAYSSIGLISTGTNIPPIANAGTNVNITLPTNSFTQSGSGTDADGTIVGYNWTQVSGPNSATIGSPNSATTLISGLIAGNYIFQLKVTDNLGATATDTMSAVVNAMVVNVPPTVNAGGNKIITLPTSTVTQNGSATPGTGTIVSYQWTQSASNPITATIVSPTNPVTVINNLGVSGVYSFTLSVTDNLGSVGSQTISVTVNPPIPVPPTAHAGVDQSITWPTNSVTLSGTATAGTGTIVSYHWVDISGDASIITNPNSASTTVTSLNIGVVKFELTVTDNSGFQGKDTMQVTVSKGTASLSYTTISVPFNGFPQQIGIQTTPAGLATNSTYNGVGQIPTNAGSYTTVSNITDLAHYNSTAITGTFTINKASVTITVSNTTQTYTGSQLPVTVTTNPNVSGISVLYNGSATVPTNAGSYTVVASLSNINYQATPVTTTLVINKATPTVSWSTPTAITYGTALSGTQLNATASVAGTFTYTPASGAILNAGTNVLSVDFTPTDGTNYNSVTGTTVSLVVNKATATISLSNLNQIFDGNPKPVTVTTSPIGLTVITTTYNGSTTVPSAIGTYPVISSLNNSNYTATPATGNLVISSSSASIFITNLNQTYTGSQLPVTVTTTPTGLTYSITYDGSATVPTNAGSYNVIATITQIGFSGADTETYVISKATPIINWANPSAITYGTALSGTQLNASTTVSGSFVYSPISGVVLNAGSYVLSTSFTPTDASNYNTASATVNITVNKATAILSLSNLNQQYDGSPKSVIATSTPSGLSGITVTYNGSLTIPINAGSYPILVTLINSNYSANNVSGTLVIAKASSILSWATPVAIQQGTALSATQLNATSNNTGTFSYNYSIGYVAQSNLTLTATFTPTDAVNYNVQTISVFQSVYGNPVLDVYIRNGHVIYLNLPNQ